MSKNAGILDKERKSRLSCPSFSTNPKLNLDGENRSRSDHVSTAGSGFFRWFGSSVVARIVVVPAKNLECKNVVGSKTSAMVDESPSDELRNKRKTSAMVDESPSDELRNKRKRSANGNVRNGERPSQKGRKLKQYVLEEKLDIIDYAKVIGNRAAGREFNVAESSIREWRKNEQRLRSMFETAPERSRLDGGGRRPVSEDLEKSLLLYVASTAGAESPLTWHAIKEKANDIWNEICERDAEFKEKDFTANMGWVARFVKRNNIQLPAPSSPSIAPERSEEPSRPIQLAKNNGSEHRQKEPVVDMAQSPNSAAATATDTITTQIASPKRRRKNFTPKKLIDHPVVESNNILLETISESKHPSSVDIPQNVTVIAMAEEDENVDVCF
ncbi:hypothetical protein Tcan_14411 [Toxocara canis]|uniref:HTH CENPB-type domain-containing protein n=1 Tax=Toxocara canis TaxID=6265 RepID=A0A0B2VQD7_TOXCA|nr:hypothetical protein Tcan_14411 [Toxocara canis]